MRYSQFANILVEAAQKPLTRDQIIHTLGKLGHESSNIKVAGNKLNVLVQIPSGAKKNEFRQTVLKDLLTGLQMAFPDYNPKHVQSTKLGSLGGIVFDGSPIAVVVKDIGKQGDNSAGVANEVELASIIKSVVQEYGSANVTFKDDRGKVLSIKDCNEVLLAGRDTSGRKKADVELVSGSGRLPISIKKLDADMWESADRLFGQKAKEILDNLQSQGAIKLKKYKDDTGRVYYQLDKEIVVEPTDEEAMNAIFGSDLNPKGGVVIQTFKPEHYTQDGKNITVAAHAVISSKEDIPETHLMVWLIRNNKERNNPLPGLRTLGVTLTRGIGRSGTKDVILVDRNGNLVSNPNIR